jgi:uncharacterized protein (TIGR01777 family)
MRIVVAGGSGFLGRPLIKRLRASGHEITQLVRRPATKPEHQTWDPAKPVELPADTGAVINLCGAGVGDHRWTEAYRREIYDSRLNPTTTLTKAVVSQGIPVLINSSGIGFYGSSGDRELTETSPPGPSDFLTDLAVKWEAATLPASEAGARVVMMRTGLPLHPDGGFLKPQMLPFKLGVGGKIGNGHQWVPWMAYEDWFGAVEFLLDSDIAGPVNLTGPKPVTNAEFTKALGETLHRPAIMPIPKLALKVLFGEFSEEAYRSFRVLPKVLIANGFTFRYPSVRTALKAALTP